MVSKQVIKVIIEAEETISKVAKEAEKAIKNMGNNGKQSMDGINQASRTAQQTMSRMEKFVKQVQTKFDTLKNKGSNAFDKIKQKIGNAVNSMGQITNVSTTASQAMERIKGISDSIENKFNSLKSSVSSFGSSSEKTFNEISNSEQRTITPLQRLNSYFSTINGSVTGFSSNVKTKITNSFTSATESSKRKLASLGQSINQAKAKLTQFSTSARNAGRGLGFLSTSASMTVGMVGYDLVNAFTQSARANINAQAKIDAFGTRLNMSGSEIESFKNDLSNLQSEFRKVDMDAVGASALELKTKFGLAKDEVKDLPRTIVIASSAFVSEGRTQEDAILAVSDALDGQMKRMLELGIDEQKLIDNGFNGDYEDKNNLLEALNNTLSTMGFEETAKQVKTLDDAYAAISVSGGQLLSAVLVPLTPYLVTISNGFYNAVVKIKGFIKAMQDAWTNMPDWQKAALLITGVGIAVSALALAIKFNLIPGVVGSALSFVTAEASSFLWMITNMGLTTTLGFLATAIWSAVTAALAFVAPILIAVAIIGALVFAIYEVGKAFGWWTDVGSMLDAIKNNIGRLWDAFIHHPDVQATIQAIGATWKWLNDTLKPVVDWLKGIWNEMFPESAKGKVDGTRAIIDAIGMAFQAITLPIRTAITVLQALYDFCLPIGQGIYEALKPIICVLLGCSPGIVPALQLVQETFSAVWSAIASIVTPIISVILTTLRGLIDNFQLFMNGQISLPELLLNIWSLISNAYVTIFNFIIGLVINFASSIISKAISAGRGLLNGILNYIKQLPSRIYSYLLAVASRILSAGIQWVVNAKNKAQAMVTEVISRVQQLPGKVYIEFMNIGSRIMQAGSDLYNKAKQIGKNIVDGLLGAMGIHSPGTIQTKVVNEFKNMVDKVKGWIKPAGESAKEMGETIVDEFGDPTLSTNSDIQMNLGVDTSQLNSANQEVVRQYDNLSNLTGVNFDDMVSQDKAAFESIRDNDTLQMSNISNIVSNNMTKMTDSVKNNMDSMVAKNREGFQSAKNNTANQLRNILSKTKSASSSMVKSWGTMKDGIVKAANTIKKDSTKHFNTLGTTIGKFYGNLRNPSRWGAGSPGISSTGRSSKGFSKITNAIQKASLPQYLTLSQVRSNPLIDSKDFGDYVVRNPKNNRFDVSDLIKYGVLNIIGKGAGAYENIPSPNIQKIKDTSKEWDMKGPLIGKFSTSKGFKVKDFLTGIPKIGFNVFRSIAEDVFGQTQYEFYYDNDHHGNWINAFNAGSMNCLHGAEALINLANAFGLKGHLVHGHWNQFGHYFANIAGHKMDVTGWQQRRTWTPSASAGPNPKGMTLEDFVEEIKQNNETDPIVVTGNNDDVEINGKVTVEHIHKFFDLPEGVSAEEVARLINDAPEQDDWLIKLIRTLVKNKDFQNLDLKEKLRLEQKENRARGI